MTNTVVVAIEQYDAAMVTAENPTGLISRREAIRYPHLPNALANQLNILLSEGVDAGILPRIESLRDAKAAALGETELLAQIDPVIRQHRGK